MYLIDKQRKVMTPRDMFPEWVDFSVDVRRLFNPETMHLIIQWNKKENSLRLNFIEQSDIDKIVPLKYHKRFTKVYNDALNILMTKFEIDELLELFKDNEISEEFIDALHLILFNKISYELYGINTIDDTGLKVIALSLRDIIKWLIKTKGERYAKIK